MFRLLAISSLLLAAASTLPAAAVVYQNTTTDTGNAFQFGANPFTQIGDQIALAGTDRVAVSSFVQLFNDGNAGTVDVILRLFQVGLPVGAQIGSDFVRTGVAAPALSDPSGGVFNVSFNLPGVLVPDNLVFTVEVTNPSAGVDIFGVDMFEPPTVGSSDNTFAIGYDGTNFVQQGTPNQNVFFELDATAPEPATFGCSFVAFFVAFLLNRHVRSAAR